MPLLPYSPWSPIWLVTVTDIEAFAAGTRELRNEGQDVVDPAFLYSDELQSFYVLQPDPAPPQEPAPESGWRQSSASTSTASSGLPVTPSGSLYDPRLSAMSLSTTSSDAPGIGSQTKLPHCLSDDTQNHNQRRRGLLPGSLDKQHLANLQAVDTKIVQPPRSSSALSSIAKDFSGGSNPNLGTQVEGSHSFAPDFVAPTQLPVYQAYPNSSSLVKAKVDKENIRRAPDPPPQHFALLPLAPQGSGPQPSDPTEVIFVLPPDIHPVPTKEVCEKIGPWDNREMTILRQLSAAYDEQFPPVRGENVHLRDQVKWEELVDVIQQVLKAYRTRHQILTTASNERLKTSKNCKAVPKDQIRNLAPHSFGTQPNSVASGSGGNGMDCS